MPRFASLLENLTDVTVDVALADEHPLVFQPGAHFVIPVVLSAGGISDVSWSSTRPLLLSYRWFDHDGKCVVRDGHRTKLPVTTLTPGKPVEIGLVGVSPMVNGDYQLVISIVLETVEWACDAIASGWLRVTATIANAPAWPAALLGSVGGRALRGALAAAELGRSIAGRRLDQLAVASPIGVVEGHSAFDELLSARRKAEDDADDLIVAAARHQAHIGELVASAQGQARQLRELERQVEVAALASQRAAEDGQRWDEILVAHKSAQARLDQFDHQQHVLLDELRGGAAVAEIIVGIRQIAAWTQTSPDEQARELATHIATQREYLEGSLTALSAKFDAFEPKLIALSQKFDSHRAAVDGALAHQAELRDGDRSALDAQSVQQSLKIDKMLLRQTIALPAAGVVLVRNPFGFLAIQDDDTLAIAYYSAGELPEAGSVAIVDRLLGPGECFLDVGANVGIYALIAARRVGASGIVVAIEPTPSTMRALQNTLAVNGIATTTKTYQCALGAKPGKATLFVGSTSGHNSLLAPPKNGHEAIEIDVRTGAEVLEDLDPALIKIDVEGWELDVVEGLQPVLARNPDVRVILECSPVHIRQRGLEPKAWLKTLRSMGFAVWVIDDAKVSLRPLRTINEITDEGANLFLSRQLPPELASMAHD